jgi:protease-4
MNFWKTFGASLLAFAVAAAVVVIGSISFLFSIILSLDVETDTLPNQSILYINIAENITDAPPASALGTLNPTSMTFNEPISIVQALTAIENAAKDGRIKGICIYCNGLGTISAANTEELRAALQKFKSSGKFIVAYDDTYTQNEYYLASVADEILINPEGSLDWHGLSITTLFYKGLLDKLDIEVDIFRPTSCKFKSAVEPFFRTNMSPENRLQYEVMLSSIWNNIVDDVAASRELQAEDLKNYAAKLMINSPEDALNYGLVDRIAYEDELFELFGEYGVKRNDKSLYNNVSLSEYVAAINISPKRVSVGNTFAIDGVEKPLVAIIYAEGQIVDGNMYSDGYVYGSRLAEELRQARLDENTKAVVVRVNSPGGSALASEIAWREMVLLQQSKPVVISMGDMAASGGYYISAPADYIFADRFTITGSIGVFGTLFNIEDTLKNKLGVTSDTAATSPSAGSITLLKPLTAEQRNALKESVDRIYTTFTSHVAEGRNLPIEDVLKIAEGRVWSGSNALEIGLVDEIGGFTEAVAKATELAGISKRYALYEFNAQLSPFEQWLVGMGTTATMNMGISENSIYFDEIRNFIIDNPLLITNGGIQTKLPGDVEIDF